jgi:hypothetical protein
VIGVMDNTAIERIATPDLTTDTLALLETYGTSDDVVFFLGRLVWQGEMTECVPALMDIACNSARGLYARIASIRGVMTVGDAEQKDRLWKTIAGHPGPLDRRLLAELLEWAAATTRSVELLLRTLESVAPFERFNTTGFEQALHGFVDRLPVMADDAEDQPLDCLVEGLNGFLGREPFIERGECHVSEEFAWLMSPASHAIDRLVAARSARALSPSAIPIMRNMPALHFWRGNDFAEYQLSLGKNVPRWRELNDLLYWTSITESRAKLAKKNQPLTDDWQIAFVGHFWGFGPEDFERCLDWVRTKADGDDRLVALSRCIHLYIQADRPAAWLKPLRAAARGNEKLETVLEARLDPKPSPVMEKVDAEHREWERQHEAREREEELRRADWVRELKGNPDRVNHPVGLKPGEFSSDQYYLHASLSKDRMAAERKDEANWRGLIPEFGEAVARAYRDAAVAHWRVYRPRLRSEGAEAGSTPYSLIFAMTGIAIEAGEDSAFAQRLTPEEARHAFRYVTWELNGFPSWFESLYRAYSAIGLEVVTKELIWELEHSVAGQPLHYILHDILYHAPWLHAEIAPFILDWLCRNDMPNADRLSYCLNILTEGGTTPDALAKLAAGKINGSSPAEQQPRWFALSVDTDPAAAIPALEAKLEGLPPDEGSTFAQQFIASLLGDLHGTGTRVSAYRNARDLKTLYILMHRYIRAADDIERAGKGVYSPTLRDNAQRTRDTLFDMLATVPGAEAYAAIKALEEEHPEPEYRRWMARRALGRATADADEPLWTVEQVRAFARDIASA